MKQVLQQMINSWQTTSAGILLVVAGICNIFFSDKIDQTVIMAGATSIVGGIGLMFSKAQNVTGGTKEQ